MANRPGGNAYKHGHAGRQGRSREYRAWDAMRVRCTSLAAEQFPHYGGRGIKVCDRWLQDFQHFLADMGECPAGLTLERKDVNANYEPGNCIWASKHTQSRNRRNNVLVEHGGRRVLLFDACAEIGLSYWTARSRIARGWPVERILEPRGT